MKKIGIYKITNPMGAVYIGESIDIDRRWSFYKRLKCKSQVRIYNSLKKYGVENHTFEIIKECLVEDIAYWERYYQEFYNVIDKNIGLNCKLRKTEEKKEIVSYETRKKQSESRIKIHINGYVSPNKGKKHTDEHRKKNSDSKKGKRTAELNNKSKILLNLYNGFYYYCIREAFDSQQQIKKSTTFKAMINGQNPNKTPFIYA